MSGLKTTLYGAAAAAILGSILWVKNHNRMEKEDAKNFQPGYAQPIGWVSEPHGPTGLFRFADPKTKLVLKGSVNQMVSDINPTPELDTDGIAQYYMDRTKESMPGWTATKLRKYKVGNTDFEVIRRSTNDRVVVTAYAVKGNTTLLVTLFGKGRTRQFVDPNIPKLYSFLDTVTLKERDMSAL